MCDELSMLHSLLFLIHTKSMSFYREVLFSTPSLFYISTNLPPRQVVRRSLLFFFVSLPSCEKSFYCRVNPNCVGRDECGDPNRNDLNHLLERDITTSCQQEARHGASSKMLWCFDNFLLFLLWTGPRARILKLPMRWCKPDEGTHRFLWPMQDGPRGI